MSEQRTSNTKLRDALEYDALAEAERATGRHSSQSEETVALGALLALAHGRKKAELLSQADDTHMQQDLRDWLGVVERLGFEKVLDEPIEGAEDRFRLFWRSGVLLRTDSYWGDKSVNSAEIYLSFKGQRDALPPCSNGFECEIDGVPVWSVGKDAREGLRYFLSQLESEGEILQEWPKRPWLWLLSYADTKVEGYDSGAINEARIAKLPEHIRNAINGK